MGKKKVKYNWRKLDNTAKIFSLDDVKDTNIFRYSVLLKENVNLENLNIAVNKSLEDYSEFKVKIGAGLFWNYLEYNPKVPVVKEENEIPCQHINFRKNNDYLFKVTYYKNKINLDIFHVLTDGTGAMTFFKNLIYHYLNITYKLKQKTKNNDISGDEDQCLKYYDKNYKMSYDFKPAYQIPGFANPKRNNTYHYIVSVKEIKTICKKLNVTITEYLTAIYIYSMYLSIYDNKSNKEISIQVPINLRKVYKNETLANFFTYMNVVSNVSGKQNASFNDVLNHVKREFKDKLTEEEIKKYLARDVNLGMNLGIRLVPLFIKKLFIKFMGVLVTKSFTSTLSNVGIVEIDDIYKKYIDNILVLVMPGRVQKIKCTICSFDDNLNISLNSNINDLNFQTTFLELLEKDLKKIKIESNRKKGGINCVSNRN